MNKYIKMLIFFIMIIFTFSLFGCSNNKKVDELEKTVADLQKQLSDIESSTTTAAAVETTAAAVEKADYTIGGTGPAGGFIFYINLNYETDGWHYLEASLNDQSDDIQWYNGSYVKTGATAKTVGTGKANTQKIVSVQGDGSYAAKLCDDLTINGYDDWFLPSKDELNKMYVNLDLKGLAGFQPNYYWSSTEYGAKSAWYQDFLDGGQYYIGGDKSGSEYYDGKPPTRVRAIRAFN